MVAPGDAASDSNTGSTDGQTSLTSTDGGTSPTTAGTEGTQGGETMTTAATGTTTDSETTAATDGEDTTAGTGEPMPANCDDFDGTIAYINFDGANLRGGAIDNAPAGVTGNASLAGDWPPYGAGDAEMVFDLLVPHWAQYDICVTAQPPAAPDYEMIVVQSEPYDGNDNILSLIGPDCGNTTSNNVEVLFLSDALNLPEITKAIAISKHLAHRFGLDSVEDNGDLMNQFVANTLNGASFADACNPLGTVATCGGGLTCPQGQQNAHEILTSILGSP